MTNKESVRFKVFAMTAPGVEMILARELRAMGIVPGEITAGGVAFEGKIEHVMRANLWSRVANRITVRVDEFHASTFHELERRAKKIEWSHYVSATQAVRFRVTCKKSRLYHSGAVTERLGNAVAAAVGGKIESDDDEESDAESQLFIVRIAHDECTISVDSSGALLHRRGYRQAVAKAPLRETLAAAMVYGSDWTPQMPLSDPLCGSGTIAIEAAMMARKLAPGVARKFAFERWQGHEAQAWQTLLTDARAVALAKAPAPIVASDRDAGAITAATKNAERVGVAGDIEFRQRSISQAEFPTTPGFLVTNPPYGVRVGESAPLRNLYAQLGKVVRARAPGYAVALLSADPALESQLRLDLREVFRTTNGGIPVRLVVGRND
ncbi:MAG TPA: THUMP domain-containing protein [Gemmatimonadaceae bacterium]|nr:THUMP domain-containing protein [Gemmatimonadaceae bacterium]